MPKRVSAPASRSVVALVYDGLCMFEFACAAEVFGLPRPEAGPDWYQFKTASLDGHPVTTQYGGRLKPQADAKALRAAGTIVIPGWKGLDVPVPRSLIEALRAAHSRGARLMSICSGAFVLAATGLLDGRRATTHWRYAARLAQKYPAITVDPGVLYVDAGQVLTSAGSAAGLDLCLHLVRRDFGSKLANQVARRLVIPPHRDGGQAQYVERPVSVHERHGLSPLLDDLQRTIDKPHSISDMAHRTNTSERTLVRRFKATTGMAPAQWLLEQRLQVARDLLEHSALPIENIAQQSGFGTAMTLRHHFRKKLGTSPTVYRRRFEAAVAS